MYFLLQIKKTAKVKKRFISSLQPILFQLFDKPLIAWLNHKASGLILHPISITKETFMINGIKPLKRH